MRIAILYICTGKYSIFWEGFYNSSEEHFLINCKKEYFIFTDQPINPVKSEIHIIPQNKIGWPFDTLFRFHMFWEIHETLAKFDYIFFFNANMLFTANIGDDILPVEEGLLAVLHPGFFDKPKSAFTYEKNPLSLAYISPEKGQYYFMGAFNGGASSEYLKLIDVLSDNIQKDLENNIIATWHDESHLNSYLLDRPIKILSPSYAYAEGWDLPFDKKIVILDKNRFGGHAFLRNT